MYKMKNFAKWTFWMAPSRSVLAKTKMAMGPFKPTLIVRVIYFKLFTPASWST